jgi:hypothetical protein
VAGGFEAAEIRYTGFATDQRRRYTPTSVPR